MRKILQKFRIKEDPNSVSFFKKLNKVVDALNAALNIQVNVIGGNGGIKHGPKGASIDVDLSSLRAGIATAGGGGGGGSTIKRARALEDAPAGNEITCNIFNADSTIAEENIEVECNITNGEVFEVAHAVPLNVEVGDDFILTVALDAGGTDNVTYTATNELVSTVSANLASLWNAEVGAEFARVSASSMGSYVRLTGDNEGQSFDITGSATNGGATDDQELEVVEITSADGLGNLNSAVPRIKEGDDIFVINISNNPSDPDEKHWVCLQLFNATEDCVCST